jgi:hypothetical protein
LLAPDPCGRQQPVELTDVEGAHVGWHRERHVAADPRTHRPAEIHRDQRQVIAVDIDPDRARAGRIDRQPHRRLPPCPAPLARARQQPVVEQPVGDIGDRRVRQPRDRGDIGAGDGSVDADGMQDDALVVLAGMFDIGSRQQR